MKIALALLIGLAGCTTARPPTMVPMPVPCVKEKPKRPALATEDELKKLPEYQHAIALEVHRLKANGYIGELEAVVDGCSKLPNP